MKKQRPGSPAVKIGLMSTVSLIMLIPFCLVIINSLKSSAQASSMGFDLPTEIHYENIRTVLVRGKLFETFLNSLLYSAGSVVLTVAATAMAAYVMARNRTKTNRALYFLVILGLAIPVNFVSLMKILQLLHLVNTQIGIILLYTAVEVPLGIMIMYGYIGTIPVELDEAATIDGSGPLRTFFLVILPLLTPVVTSVGILSFINTWNQFLFPLYFLNSTSRWPMTLAVYNFFGRYASDWNLVCADVILTSLPVVVVYLIGQRYIISGMTAGSVKA